MVDKKDSSIIWKDFVSEQEMPTFNVRNEVLNDGFQATLDSFHSWSRFLSRVEKVDDILEETYGEGQGINSAILYGSDVSGLALSPASLGLIDCEDPERGSDLDVMLLVENGPMEEDRANLAQKEMTYRNGERDYKPNTTFPKPEIEAVVYPVKEFVEDLQEAREQPSSIEELETEIGEINDIEHFRHKVRSVGELEDVESLEELDQRLGNLQDNAFLGWNKVPVNMPYHQFNLNYAKRMRAFLTGHLFHKDYQGDEIRSEIEKAEELLFNEEDEVREELEEAFYSRSPNYRNRIEELRENHRKAKVWWAINNNSELDIPRRYEINENGYAEDVLEPEKMSTDQLIEEAESQEIIVGAQTELSDYTDLDRTTARNSSGEAPFDHQISASR